jgi:hypothetical protein
MQTIISGIEAVRVVDWGLKPEQAIYGAGHVCQQAAEIGGRYAFEVIADDMFAYLERFL